MNIEKFRKVICERAQCHDEWTEGIEACWKQEIALLTEDIRSTAEFLKNDCTAEEYSWISEVFEDVITLVSDKELVKCYKDLMLKFPEEYSLYNIAVVIEGAEEILKWEAEHGKKG